MKRDAEDAAASLEPEHPPRTDLCQTEKPPVLQHKRTLRHQWGDYSVGYSHTQGRESRRLECNPTKTAFEEGRLRSNGRREYLRPNERYQIAERKRKKVILSEFCRTTVDGTDQGQGIGQSGAEGATRVRLCTLGAQGARATQGGVQAGSGEIPDREGNRAVGDPLFRGLQETTTGDRAGAAPSSSAISASRMGTGFRGASLRTSSDFQSDISRLLPPTRTAARPWGRRASLAARGSSRPAMRQALAESQRPRMSADPSGSRRTTNSASGA
jgi:hypothetical protein